MEKTCTGTPFTETPSAPRHETEDDFGVFPRIRFKYRDEGLSLEEPETFNCNPISFEEMSSALTEDVLKLNDFAVVRNRFSQGYLELSRMLERGISELASCCITKAAFEKQGVRFSGLEDLQLPMLYALISGHFRKTHSAVKETTNKNQQFWIQMLEMEFRWLSLAKRIKATDDRIRLIEEGKIDISKLLEKQENDRTRLKNPAPERTEAAEPKALPPARAVSFPIMEDFLREGNKKTPEPEKVPVPVPVVDPGQYASGKKRKKAARLVRKHARMQEAASAGQQRFSGSPAKESGAAAGTDIPLSRAAGIADDDFEGRFNFYRKKLKAMGLWADDPSGAGGSPPGRV